MRTATPASSGWSFGWYMQESPVIVLIDGMPFKALSSLRRSNLYVGTFIDGPKSGQLMTFNFDTKDLTPVEWEDELRLRFKSRLALGDFVQHTVRAIQCQVREGGAVDDRLVSAEIAKSLCGAGFDAEVVRAQWASCATEEDIADINRCMEETWDVARAWSPYMLLQFALVTLARKSIGGPTIAPRP